MEKFLVKIEFRYGTYSTRVVTIGVYDTYEDACDNGNFLIETLESKYPLRKFPDGTKAKKERFSKCGKDFITGSKLEIPFTFYATITTLKFDDVEKTISEIESAVKKFKENMSSEDEE